MPHDVPKPFQVLALSGGGFRGLYTAKVIADVEREIDAPLASRFDLITGTSIGGILALALALEIPAQKIVDLFVDHGEEIFSKRWSLRGVWRAPYSPAPLMNLLSDTKLFGDLRSAAGARRLGAGEVGTGTGDRAQGQRARASHRRRQGRLQQAIGCGWASQGFCPCRNASIPAPTRQAEGLPPCR
ncbi:MAG: patatin-like phospholipase family protein [Hydrogenophaga sp.]|nr:patatin-like phospholipase family protein [Hydrogenophaga sp.]